MVYSLIQLRVAKVRWVTGYKIISYLKSWFCAVLCLVSQSCPILCDPMDCTLPDSSVHGASPGKNNGVGCHALLQEIFATQGSNPGLVHCRQILYHLSHQGSPTTLEWVAYPFTRGSSWSRNRTSVFCIAGGFFTSWATREAQSFLFPTKWKDSWHLLEEESRACQTWANKHCWCKFLCPTHSESKQTEMLEFGAEEGSLQGPVEWWRIDTFQL